MNRLSLILALSTVARAAQASTVTYTNRAAFLAAGSNWTVENLEIVPTGSGYAGNQTTVAGLTVGGVNMLGVWATDPGCGYCNIRYSSVVIEDGFAGAQTPSSGDMALLGLSSTEPSQTNASIHGVGYALFTPQAVTYSFGFNYRAYEPERFGTPPVGFTVTLSNGYVFTGSNNSTSEFLGFISDTPIDWIRVDYAQPSTAYYATARLTYDDLTYSATSVPEPSTLTLTASAVAAGLLRRRRA